MKTMKSNPIALAILGTVAVLALATSLRIADAAAC